MYNELTLYHHSEESQDGQVEGLTGGCNLRPKTEGLNLMSPVVTESNIESPPHFFPERTYWRLLSFFVDLEVLDPLPLEYLKKVSIYVYVYVLFDSTVIVSLNI